MIQANQLGEEKKGSKNRPRNMQNPNIGQKQ